jgi:hypothetical protein
MENRHVPSTCHACAFVVDDEGFSRLSVKSLISIWSQRSAQTPPQPRASVFPQEIFDSEPASTCSPSTGASVAGPDMCSESAGGYPDCHTLFQSPDVPGGMLPVFAEVYSRFDVVSLSFVPVAPLSRRCCISLDPPWLQDVAAGVGALGL